MGLLLVSLAGWWASGMLVHIHGVPHPDPERRVPVAVAVPLLAAVLTSVGLSGADEELERATALRWRTVRVLHVLGVAVAAALVLTPIGAWEPDKYGSQVIARNLLGCFGVVTASTMIIGARLAWAPVFGFIATVFFAAPKPPTNGTAWWTWPIQPASSSVAWWTALTLFALGTALYGFAGARPASTRDELRRSR